MSITKINKNQTENGIWTNTNLIAGNNISIVQVPKPEIDDNTVALFHFDEPLSSYTTKDQIHGFSMNSILIGINSTYHKFGASCLDSGRTGSGYFPACAFSTAEDGTTLSSQLDGNFTIDFWFLHLTNTKCMQGVYLGSNSSFSTTYKLTINGNSFSLTSPEETKSINIDKSGWSNGSWHHIAVIRNSNSKELSFYLDGIKQLGVNSETWVSMSYFTISGAPRYDNGEKGYFDELRISNSVRWTSNFTPFNSPYIYGGSEPIYQIDNIQDVSSYVTSTDLTAGLATKQNTLSENQLNNIQYAYTQQNLVAGSNISIDEDSDSDGVVYTISSTGGGLPEGMVYVPAVLPNFEKYDRSLSEPAAAERPLVNDLQQAYSFTDNTNIRIPNVLADENNLSSFDIVTACKTTSSSGSGTDGILAVLVDADTGKSTLRITKDTSGYIRLRLSADFTNNDIDITSSISVLPVDQKTWLKLSYSSITGYEVTYSTDNIAWATAITSSVTTAPNNTCNNIFFGRNGTSYYYGTMYMRDTYININGQRVFNAVNIGKVPMILQ